MRKGKLQRSSRVAGKQSSPSKKVTRAKRNGDRKKRPNAKSSSVHNAKDIEDTSPGLDEDLHHTDAAKEESCRTDASNEDLHNTDAAKEESCRTDTAEGDQHLTDTLSKLDEDLHHTDATKEESCHTDAAKEESCQTDAEEQTPQDLFCTLAHLGLMKGSEQYRKTCHQSFDIATLHDTLPERVCTVVSKALEKVSADGTISSEDAIAIIVDTYWLDDTCNKYTRHPDEKLEWTIHSTPDDEDDLLYGIFHFTVACDADFIRDTSKPFKHRKTYAERFVGRCIHGERRLEVIGAMENLYRDWEDQECF